VRVDDLPPGREVQVDFGYLGMIADGERRRKLHTLVFTVVFSRYGFVWLTFPQTTAARRELIVVRVVEWSVPDQGQAGLVGVFG
jgi:transposase